MSLGVPVPAREGRPALGYWFRATWARLPLHAAVIGFAVLWSVPTVALLISSFREPSAIASSGWWTATVDTLTLDNYRTVLDQRGMGRSFINSVLITLPATALVVLVASGAAYAFAWMPFRGRGLLFLVVVGLLVVPLQMTLIPVLRLYAAMTVNEELPLLGGNVFGINSFTGIWLAHAAYGMPFAIFLLRNFFSSLPRDLIEAAKLDGASEWQVFWRIVLPLSVPALAALGIFQFLWTWNDLLIALVLLGDPDLAPMTLRITNLVGSFGSSYQLLTAAAFISMALPLVVFFAFQRFFVQGILAGATKG
ncbi:MAG: ABC transporter permease subunit [Dehalococcoidia bacterium]|nr:ABC transporter permease subunit [Dehalococcoidia bacterium]